MPDRSFRTTVELLVKLLYEVEQIPREFRVGYRLKITELRTVADDIADRLKRDRTLLTQIANQFIRIYQLDLASLGFPRTPTLFEALNRFRHPGATWLFIPHGIDFRSVTKFLVPEALVIPNSSEVAIKRVSPRHGNHKGPAIVVHDFEELDFGVQRALCDASVRLVATSCYDKTEMGNWPMQWINAEIGVRDRIYAMYILNDELDLETVKSYLLRRDTWADAKVPVADFVKSVGW